jgi:hypothetical protein
MSNLASDKTLQPPQTTDRQQSPSPCGPQQPKGPADPIPPQIIINTNSRTKKKESKIGIKKQNRNHKTKSESKNTSESPRQHCVGPFTIMIYKYHQTSIKLQLLPSLPVPHQQSRVQSTYGSINLNNYPVFYLGHLDAWYLIYQS